MNASPLIEAAEYRLTQLRTEAETAKGNLHQHTGKISVVDSELSTLIVELDEMSKEYEAHQKASAFLKELIRVVSTENIYKVEHLVNSALHQIFPTRSLSFRINSSIKRNLTEYEFQLLRDNDLEKAGSMESNGGGVWSLIAFVLQVTFNCLAKRFPLIVLDESLVAISSDYISGTSQLIRELSEQFGLIVLLVTHQSLFVEGATSSYLARPRSTQGTPYTVFEKVK